MQTNYTFKIIFGGEGGVGKTTMLHRFVENRFLEDTKLTIGVEIFNKEMLLPDESLCALQLWDFGGQERFRFMLESFIRGASGAFLMFDLTTLFTFHKLGQWLEMFRKNDPNLPIILLGTKYDLEHQTVREEYVENFINENNVTAYLRISSKTGYNVNEAFDVLLKQIMINKKLI